MRKFISIILSAALFFSLSAGAAGETADAAGEKPSPKAAVLYEAQTGQMLYSVNPAMKLPMASVTKIMTLLVLSDEIDAGRLLLNDLVKASSYASSATGSVIWLEPGEEMTAAELIEAVIVSSANDACIALAEHTAGSEAQFVKLMNRRAKSMGLKNTRFTGCVGYDDEGHYSSAEDIAVAAAELMEKEYFRAWFLTRLDYLRGGKTQLLNTNKLLSYSGMLGGKTGTTDGAGCCLSVCAERGDMRLVAVVLGCGDDPARFDEAETLLDYGFSSFERFTPEIDRTKLVSVPVDRGELNEVKTEIRAPGDGCIIKRGRSRDIKYEYTFVERAEAPVEKGQFMGEYLVTLDGIEVFRSDITAKQSVRRMSFVMYLLRVLAEIISM